MHLNGLTYHFTIEQTVFRVSMFSDGMIESVIPGHSHAKGCYEIHCITEGTGSVLLGDTRFFVSANSLYVTGPHIFHEQTSDPTNPMAEICIYLQLLPSSEGQKKSDFVNTFINQTSWIGTDTNGVLPIMKQIQSEITTPTAPGHTSFMSGLFMQLFCALVRCYKADMPTAKEQKSSFSSLDPVSPLTIEEAFLNNYKTITLTDLAKATHLSVRQLQRLLQKQYGTTFQKKRTQARISTACILLKNTPCSLNEIAEQTGYSSPEHFSYAFHKQMGCTPGAYRKQSLSRNEVDVFHKIIP